MSESSEVDEAPEISIVIATFDRPDALSRCLESLSRQTTMRRLEIIVVDNHPQSSLTAPLAFRFPFVRWLSESRQGLSTARNRGVSAARGLVTVTTDDDVIPPADWLEILTRPLFDKDGRIAVTTGNCLPLKVETEAEKLFEAYGGLGHGDVPLCFDAEWMQRWHVAFPQLWRIGTTANAAFLTEVLRDPRVGSFETRLGAGTSAGAWEDIYCFYRILQAGYRICYLPEASVIHAHRARMDELKRQLCAYRRGETAFLWLIFQRHHDLRAFGQMLLWIPYWRLRLMVEEFGRRLLGHRRYSFRMFWFENLAYLEGPWSIKQKRN